MEYGMPDTKIAECNCDSQFQDSRYGKKKRVMNHAPNKGSNKNRYRCTVCKKEHTLN